MQTLPGLEGMSQGQADTITQMPLAHLNEVAVEAHIALVQKPETFNIGDVDVKGSLPLGDAASVAVPGETKTCGRKRRRMRRTRGWQKR